MRIKEAIKNTSWINKITRSIIRWLAKKNPVLATRMLYYLSSGKKLDLKNPKTFNEKLQWLKLYQYQDNDIVTMAVDKYKVREYIESIGHSELLNELYGVYDCVDDIDIEKLPNAFVLKCNHDCGSVVICKDKASFDWKTAKKKLSRCLQRDYWLSNVEVQYKNVEKKVICEKYLTNVSLGGLIDYKFFCFNGKPLFLYSSYFDDNGEWFINYYDCNWKLLEVIRKGHKNDECIISKPNNFEDMKQIAAELSKPFPFVRVDLFTVDEKIEW